MARREAEQRVRREHIMRTAEQVFASRPFEDASMQRIAEEAGIGMNGLYRHFASKQELYEAIVVERLEEIRARLQAVPPSAAPDERIRRIAAAYAQFFLDRPRFFPLWSTHRLAHDWSVGEGMSRKVAQRVGEVEADVARAIAAAVDAGVLRPIGVPLLVGVAIGIFAAVIQHHLLHAKTRDADACAAEMCRLLLEGAGA